MVESCSFICRERGCLRNLGPGGWGIGGAYTHICIVVVNPRRACTARVTVVCLYLCVSVCLSARYPLLVRLQAQSKVPMAYKR